MSEPGKAGAAGGPEVPDQQTWRPRLAPVVAVTVGTGLLIASVGMWWGLPAETKAEFSWIQVVTLVAFLAALLAGLGGIARTRVSVDKHGLTVVNVFRVHRLDWAQVLAVNFRPGDPWAQLDLADGTTLGVMAIQSADGDRARETARRLRALAAAKTRTARDD